MTVYWDFTGGPMVKNPHFTAKGAGSIPGWGTKILHVMQCAPPKKDNLLPCIGFQCPKQGLGNFFYKGPDIKCFRLCRPHKGSATTIQLCDCNIKAATDSNE